jgi:glycosyltransferase involved in cell wall biosynthesis
MNSNKKIISVALATYNEEKNIARCLKSVKDWADEIVVVDGGSSDNTVKIAKKYGAKIIHAGNPQVFHINKQKAIDACKGKWILQLDADEIVSQDLQKEILKTTLNSQLSTLNSVNGYWIPRRNLFLGKWLKKGGQYPDYTLRLYRNGKGHLPCKTVHEQTVVEGKVEYLKNDLVHYADPTFSRYIMRNNRYTSLMATLMDKEGLKLNSMNFVGYFFFKPIWWFVKTYFRHKGFVDGFPGFVFALYSSLRFPTAYIKYWESKNSNVKAQSSKP